VEARGCLYFLLFLKEREVAAVEVKVKVKDSGGGVGWLYSELGNACLKIQFYLLYYSTYSFCLLVADVRWWLWV
jgi:hypothetical protein